MEVAAARTEGGIPDEVLLRFPGEICLEGFSDEAPFRSCEEVRKSELELSVPVRARTVVDGVRQGPLRPEAELSQEDAAIVHGARRRVPVFGGDSSSQVSLREEGVHDGAEASRPLRPLPAVVEPHLEAVPRERLEEEEELEEQESPFDPGFRGLHGRSPPRREAGVDAAAIRYVEDRFADGRQELLQLRKSVPEALQEEDAEKRVAVAREEAVLHTEELPTPAPVLDVGHEALEGQTVVEELLEPLAVADSEVVLECHVDLEAMAAHEKQRHLGLGHEADVARLAVLLRLLLAEEPLLGGFELSQDLAPLSREFRP